MKFLRRLVHRPSGRRIAVLEIFAAAYVGVCTVPLWGRGEFVLALTTMVVCLAFCTAPLLLRDERGRGGAASLLLLAAGLLWPTNYVYGWGGSFALDVSMIGSTVFWWVAGCVCLIYPQQRLDRMERTYLIMLGVGLGLPDLCLLVSGGVYQDFPGMSQVAAVAGLAFVIVAALRYRRYRGVERQTLAPVLLVGTFLALSGGVSWFFLIDEGIYTPHARQHLIDLIYCAEGILLLLAPISLIYSGFRRRFVKATVAEVLFGLQPGTPIGEVVGRLREALQDDRLEVLYWSPGLHAYVDASGQERDASDDKLIVPISAEGKHSVLLMVDRQLAGETALFDHDAVSGPTTSSFMTWLAGDRAVYSRLEAERWREREEIGRNLHDGLQQQLYRLGFRLAEAETEADDAGSERLLALVRDAQEQFRVSVKLLRETAQGLAPVELVQFGIEPTLRMLAQKQPIETDSVVTYEEGVHRAPKVVECMAYYVACEALTNAAKHSEASWVEIRTRISSEMVVIQVTDNGRGGAVFDDAGGLSGLKRRLQLFDGDLDIQPTETGTKLMARIPCAYSIG